MDEGHPEGPLSLFLSCSFQVNDCYSEWLKEVFTQKAIVYSIKFKLSWFNLFLLKFFYYYFMSMGVSCPYVSVYHSCMPGVCEGEK